MNQIFPRNNLARILFFLISHTIIEEIVKAIINERPIVTPRLLVLTSTRFTIYGIKSKWMTYIPNEILPSETKGTFQKVLLSNSFGDQPKSM